nr:chromo domain-like [Tanacetum cinerariifolium]
TAVVTSYDREVENILSDRTIRRGGVPSYKEYLIKWRDLPDSEAGKRKNYCGSLRTRLRDITMVADKLKCEIDESKNRNKFLETSNKVLIDKLKSEIEDFKNKNKSLELLNNQFKEANNKMSKENDLLYADFKKSQAELKRRDSIEYASEMELECAKLRGDFLSYKMKSQKSCNKYTQTISKMKNMLSAHQDTISILSKQKEAQIKHYKTQEDKELKKVIELENKVKTHPTHYNQNSSTRTQQAATRNRGKAIVKSPQPIYDQEPFMVDDDDETSKDKEIDKLIALISLSNAGYESQRSGNVAGAMKTVGSSMVQKSGIQCYNCKEYGHVARECQKPKRAKDAAYHREKMLLCKQEEARIQLNAEQANRKDDTDNEFDDQELEAHYIYMAKLQQVSLDVVDSGPIFDTEPEQKVQNDDHYDVFAIDYQHLEQSESVYKTYLIEQDAHDVLIESVDMNYDSEQIDQNNEDAYLAKECELLASLIEKLKCEIDESKNRNKLLETSNKVLTDKLKSEIEDFKNKNKSLELSYNQSKEANNKLSKENDLILSREYYYADHMNAILGVYIELDEVTNLQCDYLELLQKCECLETELSKSKIMSKSFKSVQKHAINLELELQQCKEKVKNDMSFKVNKLKDFCKERE